MAGTYQNILIFSQVFVLSILRCCERRLADGVHQQYFFIGTAEIQQFLGETVTGKNFLPITELTFVVTAAHPVFEGFATLYDLLQGPFADVSEKCNKNVCTDC